MQAKFGRYQLQAGVLRDRPHKEPKPVKQALAEMSQAKRRPKQVNPKTNPKPKSKAKRAKTKSKGVVKQAKKKISSLLESKKSKAEKRKKAMIRSNRARGLGTLEGGPVRLKKASTKGTVQQIAQYMRKRHGIPFLREPFLKDKSPEMKTLKRELMKLISGRVKGYSKVETALRAVIRVPFLKKRYGRNSRAAQRTKTFDRLGIDTGQVFQALDGKVRVNPSVQK